MKISLSKLYELYEIVMDFFGLLHRAEEVLSDKPATHIDSPAVPSGPPRDETDPDNKFNLNQ